MHKVMNVLNKLPKSIQPKAKADLKEIWMAEGRDDAEKAFDRFLARYQVKYEKAADCLAKDRDALLAFYDFPAEHWKHIRTGNPIESTFATVRHRTVRAKGCLSYETAKIMVFKMIQTAQKSWRKLDGQNQLPKASKIAKLRRRLIRCRQQLSSTSQTSLADMDTVCRQALANLLEREVRFVGRQLEKPRSSCGGSLAGGWPYIGFVSTLPVLRLRRTHLTTGDGLRLGPNCRRQRHQSGVGVNLTSKLAA